MKRSSKFHQVWEEENLQMAQISTMGTSSQVAQNMEGCFFLKIKKDFYM
jgi:hypothetical protein